MRACACGLRTRVAPEHPGRVEVARVGELAGRPSGSRPHAGRSRRRARARACVAVALMPGRPAGRRRRSSGSRCSGRGCPRAPRGSRRRSGSALRSSRSAVATTRPGVQKPHWTAPALDERLLHRGGARPSCARPSTVTTSWPSACAARTRQEQTSVPSRSTEHEPHSPCSQAFFEPGQPEPLAQRVQQALAAPDVGLAPLAVDGQRDLHASAPLQSAPGQDAERVAAVGGRAAHVVDRARRLRDEVGEAGRVAKRRRHERRDRGRRAERGAQLAALPVDRRRRASTTAITIAFRGPTFMNVCGAPLGVTRTATTSSSGSSAFRFGPTRNSETGILRAPRTLATSTSAPSTRSGGSASPAGEAVPRLPPIVPRLRICGEPTVREASASAGSSSASGAAHRLGVGQARRRARASRSRASSPAARRPRSGSAGRAGASGRS